MSWRDQLGGDLRAGDEGRRVTLAGWVASRRDHGGLVFVDLRDQAGVVQLVFNPDEQAAAHAVAHAPAGRVRRPGRGRRARALARDGEPAPRHRPDRGARRAAGGARRPRPALPFQLDDEGVDETLRLRHRYLDLRRDEMRHNVWVRFKLTQTIRRYLEDRGFWELETPILYKSTPEGAREFLVPTSSHPGKFYALPQSPQTYKQLYVISGFERYYQIARCFRDEATRADRTAEFTQLDMELAFVEPGRAVRAASRACSRPSGARCSGSSSPLPFPRLTHDEAMLRYASDKPDTRFGCEIADVTDALRGHRVQRVPGRDRRGRGGARVRRPRRDGVLAQGLRRPGRVRPRLGRQGRRLAAGDRARRGALADREVPGRGRGGGDRGRHRRRAGRHDPARGRRASTPPCACSGRCGCTWASGWA